MKQDRLELEALERELGKLDDRRSAMSKPPAPLLTVAASNAPATNVSLPTTPVTNVPALPVAFSTANLHLHPIPSASQPHLVPQSYLQQLHPISVVPSTRNPLPVNEQEVFDGTDVVEHRFFLLCFDMMTAQHCSTKVEMFYHMQRHTKDCAQ